MRSSIAFNFDVMIIKKIYSHILFLSIALLPILAASCSMEKRVCLKDGVSVLIPEGATDEDVIRLATKVRPSCRQLDYQSREMVGFIHFGVNTFTQAEWGTGKESPTIFNPTNLDAEKWIKTFKDAGITAVIFVAKHHDGFCLWPSKYTSHTVASSSWRKGEGDLLREVADACKKHDIKLCVYLSPWDMHEPSYGTSAYNDFYINQIEEVLTNYGDIYLLWFDGAGLDKATSGVNMDFDWQRIFARARELQPDILLSGSAPDIRWVGNEVGKGHETEWSVQGIDAMEPLFGGEVEGFKARAKDLGSIKQISSKKRLVWYPSRGGLPFRKGWFYKSQDDNSLKSLSYLVDSYFSTVGQNSNLLPNLSPDTTGNFPEKDAARLIELGEIISEMKKVDVAKGAEVKNISGWEKNSNSKYITDDDLFTSWNTRDGVTEATLEIILPKSEVVNVIKLQENVRDFGQRVESFAVDAWIDNGWQQVAKSTTIGYRKMLRLEQEVHTDRFRVRINEARISISLGNISLYYLKPFSETSAQGALSDDCNAIAKDKLKITPFGFEHSGNASGYVFELDDIYTLDRIIYKPDVSEKTGHIENYNVLVSEDGVEWKEVVANARFGNIRNNPTDQLIELNKSRARFVTIEIIRTTAEKISVKEFVVCGIK